MKSNKEVTPNDVLKIYRKLSKKGREEAKKTIEAIYSQDQK